MSSVPPSNSLISLLDAWRAFWSDTGPFTSTRALASPCALLPELLRNKDTVNGVALGADVPEHCQEQFTLTLIVCLLKTNFFSLFLKLGGPGPPFTIPLVSQVCATDHLTICHLTLPSTKKRDANGFLPWFQVYLTGSIWRTSGQY